MLENLWTLGEIAYDMQHIQFDLFVVFDPSCNFIVQNFCTVTCGDKGDSRTTKVNPSGILKVLKIMFSLNSPGSFLKTLMTSFVFNKFQHYNQLLDWNKYNIL